MTTDLEHRLRTDLPRLAEVIATERDVASTAATEPQRRRPRVLVAAAAGTALVLVAATAIVVGRARHTATPATIVTPTPTTAPAFAPGVPVPPSPLGPRAGVVAVWTGHDVLVWGGYRGNANAPLALQTGAAYDPATETWRAIAPNQWAHPGAIGVWAGERLYVLAKTGGAVYDPATDAWHDIASLPGPGGFVGATWSGSTLYALVSGDAPNTIAVATYDAGNDSWRVGPPTAAAWRQGDPSTSVVWTGSEVVATDGRGLLLAYDPASSTWDRLPALPKGAAGATATALTMLGSKLVVVFGDGHQLTAATADADAWTVVAHDATLRIVSPRAVDAGGTLVVVDALGGVPPVRADGAGGWQPLSGFHPSIDVPGQTAVWAGTGLFVWSGLPPDTPATFTNPSPEWISAGWFPR